MFVGIMLSMGDDVRSNQTWVCFFNAENRICGLRNFPSAVMANVAVKLLWDVLPFFMRTSRLPFVAIVEFGCVSK
jgi:hypothetical protein